MVVHPCCPYSGLTCFFYFVANSTTQRYINYKEVITVFVMQQTAMNKQAYKFKAKLRAFKVLINQSD